MVSRGLALAAALALAVGGVARAQDAETEQDIRCLVVGFTLAGSEDAQQKQVGTYVSLYFLGRLDDHAPQIDLEGRIADAIRGASQADLSANAKACGDMLKARGDALQTIGDDLAKQFNTPAAPAPAPAQ